MAVPIVDARKVAGFYLVEGWRQFVDSVEYVDAVALVAILAGPGLYVSSNRRRAHRRARTT